MSVWADGVWAPGVWAVGVWAEEAAPNQPPATPTATGASAITSSSVLLGGSPWSDPDGDPPILRRWQVALVTDTAFASPVADTGLAVYVQSANIGNLDPSTSYVYRLMDSDGVAASQWSAASAPFSTLAAPPAGRTKGWRKGFWWW